MRKIYYDKINKKEIVDISGEKTLEQIKKEFENVEYQTLIIDENVDGYCIKDGKLEKYSLEEEQQKELQIKETEKQLLIEKESILKTKLGLTTEEFEDLKKIVKTL